MRQSSAPSSEQGTRPFMLTLCRLTAHVTIRPPQAPQLKSFTFFVSHSREADGSESLHLNMGYFATLAEAQKWGQLLRPSYPEAIVVRAPDTDVTASNEPLAEGEAMTDTQVIRVLETRRGPSTQAVVAQESSSISVVRPEDTSVRRILKEAVLQNAPVSFAVQLRWSVQPIDLALVPSMPIFRAYKLYVSNGNREGRSWYCLRLGFFNDALSAKQVAYHLRSSFTSVAVVPVTEAECTYAEANRISATALAS
jgi:hypothetical protein